MIEDYHGEIYCHQLSDLHVYDTLGRISLRRLLGRLCCKSLQPGAGLLKLSLLISASGKSSDLQKYLAFSLIKFIFDKCHHKPAAAIPVRYEHVTGISVVLKKRNGENSRMEEIGLVAPMPGLCDPLQVSCYYV